MASKIPTFWTAVVLTHIMYQQQLSPLGIQKYFYEPLKIRLVMQFISIDFILSGAVPRLFMPNSLYKILCNESRATEATEKFALAARP